MDYISEILSGAVLLAVAIIEGRAGRERKEQKEEKELREKRAARRAEESRLSIEMQEACLLLAEATAIAVEKGEVNGHIKKARQKAAQVQAKYEEFINRVAAEQMSKV